MKLMHNMNIVEETSVNNESSITTPINRLRAIDSTQKYKVLRATVVSRSWIRFAWTSRHCP